MSRPYTLPFPILVDNVECILKGGGSEEQKTNSAIELIHRCLVFEETDDFVSRLHNSTVFRARLRPASQSKVIDSTHRYAAAFGPKKPAGRHHVRSHDDDVTGPISDFQRRYVIVKKPDGSEEVVTQYDIDRNRFGVYIDNQITSVTSNYNHHAGGRVDMIVNYSNGKSLTFPLHSIPITWKYTNSSGARIVRIKTRVSNADHYVLAGGFVWPVDAAGDVLFNKNDTPNLSKYRSTIYDHAVRSGQLVEIAELVNAFASIVKMNGDFASSMSLYTNWGRPPLPYFKVQNGRLVQTVPPAGRVPLCASLNGRIANANISYKQSLATAQRFLADKSAFQAGKPQFRSIKELDKYWTSKGFFAPKTRRLAPKTIPKPGRLSTSAPIICWSK